MAFLPGLGGLQATLPPELREHTDPGQSDSRIGKSVSRIPRSTNRNAGLRPGTSLPGSFSIEAGPEAGAPIPRSMVRMHARRRKGALHDAKRKAVRRGFAVLLRGQRHGLHSIAAR